MTSRFTPQLDRDVVMRGDTSDAQTWIDTFEIGYHVPPEIDPKFVLDLGANIGFTAAHYAAMWPEAMIIAVEMDAENTEICQRNFSGLVVNVAVGALPGQGSYQHEGWEARYSLLRPGDTLVHVVTITQLLDDCMPGADEVFCKMDIEGAEWDIFARGVDTRIKWLLVELHNTDEGHTVDDGIDLLRHDGFAVARHLIHPFGLWATR